MLLCRLRHYLAFCRIQHILDENAVPFGRVGYEYVSDGTDELAVLNDGATRQECGG